MNEKDVFISYKAEELNEAMWVRDRLEEQGISCWLAPGSIPGGSSYAVQIPRAIRECVAFVLILSNNAQESKWVPRELDQAINANKVILPFSIENCQLKDEFSFYLSNVQRYDAWQNREKAFSSMVRVIKALIKERDEARAEEERAAAARAALENANAGAAGQFGANVGANTQSGAAFQQGTQPGTTAKKHGKKGAAAKAAAGQKKGGKKGLKNAAILLAVLAFFFFGQFAIRAVIDKMNTFTVAGKEFKKQSTSIYLYDTEITEADLAQFSKFENLSTISLDGCTIQAADLSPILRESLGQLTITNCGLTREQAKSLDLTKTPQLYMLSLSENPELAGGAGSKEIFPVLPEKLYCIRINHTGIADLEAFAEQEKLTTLEAAGNGISDITPVTKLVKMDTLNLAENEITSLDALKDFHELRSLNVSDNQLTSLAGIELCLRMEVLGASGNSITDLAPIANMTVLQKVYLARNGIADIDTLSKSAATLTELDLSDNLVADLKPLADCRGLKVLLVEKNSIADLSPLSYMKMLETLDVSENALVSVKGITRLGSLTWIDLSVNPFEGTVGLYEAEWPADRDIDLDLSNCETGSTLTLAEGLSYHYLDLHGNRFDKLPASVSTVSGRTIVLDWIDGLTPDKLEALQFSYITLLDIPADQQVAFEDALRSKLTLMTTEEYEAKNEEIG